LTASFTGLPLSCTAEELCKYTNPNTREWIDPICRAYNSRDDLPITLEGGIMLILPAPLDNVWGGLLVGAIVLIAPLASIAAVVLVLVLLPATHFRGLPVRSTNSTGSNSSLRWVVWLLRNALGFAVIVVGIILSLPGIPGQGLLTILIGVIILDFQKKRWLERKLVERPGILQSINRLRNRFHKPPLILDDKPDMTKEPED
jgi:hypothetical protein